MHMTESASLLLEGGVVLKCYSHKPHIHTFESSESLFSASISSAKGFGPSEDSSSKGFLAGGGLLGAGLDWYERECTFSQVK